MNVTLEILGTVFTIIDVNSILPQPHYHTLDRPLLSPRVKHDRH